MFNFFKKIHVRPKKAKKTSNLHHRFIAGVLAPPFVILLLLGIIIIWQLNSLVRDQAIDELNRAASTTAAKLEREFALRQTILKRTGEELFVIKSQYQTDLAELEKDRAACNTHLKQGKSFQTAPDGACQPFQAEFATSGASQATVENGYVNVGEQMAKTQKSQINERLTSYGQFFPETAALIIADADGKIVSSAINEVFKGSADTFSQYIVTAKKSPVEGTLLAAKDYRIAVFAYPISGGSALAAYDLTNDNFLRETWKSTPINSSQAVAIILDSKGIPAYPAMDLGKDFTKANQVIRKGEYATIALKDVVHIATGAEAENSKWGVVVASPRTAVLAPVRDAQIAAVLIVGGLLIGFLWVGTYFIQRTLRSILRLVSGALIFSAGKLDYKINLETSDEEFIALADTMNNMAERIAAAEKEIDDKNKEFISIATHELRTPLTAIKGNLSMVVEDFGSKLDEAVKPAITQAYTSTTRLATLVNDMLDMARLDGNRVEFEIAPQDIKTLANDVVENLRVIATAKPVSLLYDPTNAMPVLADAAKLRIVLNNFISNAIKYNRSNGSVKVSHDLKDDKLITIVADTGLGIPEDQKSHMFEKFFRVQNEDRKDIVGTGLGMYITREYVIKMGGEVWFESIHGQGTTFYFTLPLANNQNVNVSNDKA